MPRRRAFKQLRIRYSLQYVAIFAFASLAFLVLLLLITDYQRRASHEFKLLKVTGRMANKLTALRDPWLTDAGLSPAALAILNDPDHCHLYVELIDTQDESIWRCRSLRESRLPLPKTRLDQPYDVALDYYSSNNDTSMPRTKGRLCMAATALYDANNRPIASLLVGQSDEGLKNTLFDNRRVLIVFFISSLIVVGWLIWYITGRWLRPLLHIADQAAQITPTKIDRRLEIETTSRELVDLVETMNQMLARIENGYRQQYRFIGNVSHELRTPLTVLLGETRTVLTRYPADSPQAELARKVSVETRRMIDLVSGFMILARASEKPAVPTDLKVAIEDVVLTAVGRESENARNHQVKVVPRIMNEDADAASVRGDSDLLVLMCTNLIRNAVRYSPEGGTVYVEMAMTPDGEFAEVIVRDSGKGIPEGEFEKIFDMFHQVDPVRGDVGTGGIGLTIVRAVAQQHGGTVSVRNLDGDGCEFRVRLPLAKE